MSLHVLWGQVPNAFYRQVPVPTQQRYNLLFLFFIIPETMVTFCIGIIT